MVICPVSDKHRGVAKPLLPPTGSAHTKIQVIGTQASLSATNNQNSGRPKYPPHNSSYPGQNFASQRSNNTSYNQTSQYRSHGQQRQPHAYRMNSGWQQGNHNNMDGVNNSYSQANPTVCTL